MSRLFSLLTRATLADGLLLVAALALVAALLRPAWSARDFREEVTAAAADVNVLIVAARNTRGALGRWPAAAAPGEAPPELSGLGGVGGIFTRPGYTLGWTTWEVVDSVAVPPDPEPPPAPGDAPREPERPRMQPVTRTVGAVTVRAGNTLLLAELLRHYGAETSFVLDTMWLMVLPERS